MDQENSTDLERLCIERGMKMTEQRRIIARVLSDADDHPDVEDLYKRSVKLDPKISIATVYRTVRLLRKQGCWIGMILVMADHVTNKRAMTTTIIWLMYSQVQSLSFMMRKLKSCSVRLRRV